MSKNRETNSAGTPSPLTGYATVLGDLGPNTRKATAALNATVGGGGELVEALLKDVLRVLADEFDRKAEKQWSDEQAAAVIDVIRKRLCCDTDQLNTNELKRLDLPVLSQWLRIHHNDAQQVIDCLTTEPPEEISIIRLLSRAGSQKLVFLANWHIAQREVVLKRFIAGSAAERVRRRELLSHPLSMEHPNIIETHFLKNSKNETFLVERRLPEVLSDNWRAQGVEEAANLLRDIASALAFLQQKQFVHGDIKPDNIGFEDGRYILLDFGICRSEEEFSETATPTGSLRTRAPELLVEQSKHSHSCDLWALGATVFNTIAGHFPLFNPGEGPPRVSKPDDRAKFEVMLAERVRCEYNQRVTFPDTLGPLRPILAKMLSRDPHSRGAAKEIVDLCQLELAAFLRVSEGPSNFSPAEELEQMSKYLPRAEILRLMPSSQKHDLRERLSKLHQHKGLTTDQHLILKDLEARIL
jgi:serine/threonine protein kinase